MTEKKKETGFINQFEKARKLGLEVPVNKNKGKPHKGTPHTEESKKKISEKRKEYLKNNPDKHNWKNNNKFKSVPCEKFKQILRENNISFLEEQTPLAPEHFYSADISFPDKKIIIEINGNQHYNPDKTLKPYYQERHNLLEQAGWIVYEFHYSISYDENLMNELIKKLKSDYNLSDVKYDFYIKTKKVKIKKERITKLKFEVSKEELEKLILEKPMTDIGKMFGVSDHAIRKRCKRLGIELPKLPVGYWLRKPK
jgi:very-short-patch-repair endonuclease